MKPACKKVNGRSGNKSEGMGKARGEWLQAPLLPIMRPAKMEKKKVKMRNGRGEIDGDFQVSKGDKDDERICGMKVYLFSSLEYDCERPPLLPLPRYISQVRGASPLL